MYSRNGNQATEPSTPTVRKRTTNTATPPLSPDPEAMAPRSHGVDMILEVPCPMGRVSWAHGEADNSIHLFFEPLNEADPNHHRPPTRAVSTLHLADITSQPQPPVTTTAHVAPYIGEDEYLYTDDDEDDTSTQSTDTDQASHMANSATKNNTSGADFASADTPLTSVNSDAIILMHDHHDDEGNFATNASQLVWPRCDNVEIGIMGAWLPARFERPADAPQNMRELTMAGIREDPSGSSIEDILSIVERNRDEMYVERFRRAAQA